MRVNLCHPSFWHAHGHWDYKYQLPKASGSWGGISYAFNNNSSSVYDFVVVHEDVDDILRLKCRVGGLVLVTGEEKSIKSYDQEFLNQFDLIITSRDDIRHADVIKVHYFHPWRVRKSYDELVAIGLTNKYKKLSAIVSNLTILPSHKQRYAFINKLKGHYKQELDWYAKGESSFLEDKWDGLAPYEYSIAIENSSYLDYFTEKISDCFLASTMPLYSGCPNITDYFDDRSLVKIDVSDFAKSIDIINDSIEKNLYQSNLKFIEDSRRLVLEKYHFIAALSDVLTKVKKSEIVSWRKIQPQFFFRQGAIKRFIRNSSNYLFKK